MTEDEAKQFIELEVRRLLDAEIGAHRDFLEGNLKRATAVIAVLAALGSGLLVYFLGRDYRITRETLTQEIGASVMRYRIDEKLRQEVGILTADIVNGLEFRRQIDDVVAKSSEKIVPNSVNDAVADVLAKESEALQKENVERYLARSADARLRSFSDEVKEVDKRLQMNSEKVSALESSLTNMSFVSTNCRQTPNVNAFDGPMDAQCNSDEFIRGIWSVHDSGREDRVFRFYCCKVRSQ